MGQAVNEAMRVIEPDNPQLAGVLPKTYEIFDSVLLEAAWPKDTHHAA